MTTIAHLRPVRLAPLGLLPTATTNVAATDAAPPVAPAVAAPSFAPAGLGMPLAPATARSAAGVSPAATRVRAVRGGVNVAADRTAFDRLALREDKPGAAFAPTIKFLIADADTASPKVWLIDGNAFEYHFNFKRTGLGRSGGLDERADLIQFNQDTYWNDNRKYIAGYVVAHDHFHNASSPAGTSDGVFAMEFWAADGVKAKHVILANSLLQQALPFAKDRLVYHPQSDTQEAQQAKDQAALTQAGVQTLSTQTLFENVDYCPLNTGEGFGVLRFFDGSAPAIPPSVRDVCVYTVPPPNDLAHVAGLITAQPQTPLSHTNLKAKQNKTPNAFIKGCATDANLRALEGKLVRYVVTPDGPTITPATEAEAKAYLDKVRPKRTQNAPRLLREHRTQRFADLSAKDARAYGAKTANLAELRRVFAGTDIVPDGVGIPFYFYDAFMKHKGLVVDDGQKTSGYTYVRAMMDEPRFQSDTAYRQARLAAFQQKLLAAEVPPALKTKIDAIVAEFPAGTRLRCRSSTNNEDLKGFNGAGLYDSYTHRRRDGDLSNTVKQTWASLWNFRAFEEREFWRIDHLKAAMGVTVHPNSDDEEANGVALTKNPFDANWRGFYINAQIGENLVTNPQAGAVPEETLVSAIGQNGELETQRIRTSSLANGKPVLTPEQLKTLVAALQKLHDHFAAIDGKAKDDPSFGMDVEWKILASGELLIKQARPVVG